MYKNSLSFYLQEIRVFNINGRFNSSILWVEDLTPATLMSENKKKMPY